MSWESAGAFVWHELDVDATRLGMTMRENGFGWIAVRLHDGLEVDPLAERWIESFQAASGLPVGGWGVLRDKPEAEAKLAGSLVDRLGLDFYVADAEAAYEYSGAGGPSDERSSRSRRFVNAFRRLEPSLPAGLSSYCRPTRHDIDWAAWQKGGFVFLPQAYVNQVGPAVAPRNCVEAAASYFPPNRIHPTIGTFRTPSGIPSPADYVRLLEQARTIGFSVYPAETTSDDSWRVLGAAISASGIARSPALADEAAGRGTEHP
jgi:hypothetical protein